MRKNITKWATALLICSVASCKMLEPENDNHNTLDRVSRDPAFAEGLLIRAYTFIPTNSYNFDDIATDNAVSNDRVNNFLRMATGEWTARFNPQNQWDNANAAIMYINQFLNVVDEIPWKRTNSEVEKLYARRFRGEALALRALFKYFLLRNHGGIDAGGAALGIPLYDSFLENRDDFSTPRATFEASIQSIYADVEEAQKYLPMDFGNITSVSQLANTPYADVTSVQFYNDVFGEYPQQRITARHALATKARAALLAASPAFNLTNNGTLWVDAANQTSRLLDDVGGVNGLDPKGHLFYLKEQVDAADITTGDKLDLREIMWRRPFTNDRDRETANFPPSLYGNGRINPTQNLVDAFPMANGYPIDHEEGAYDPTEPYAGRDPRLAHYIVFNGSSFKGATINTSIAGGDNGIESLPTSTRTGYYLKKLLREDVNVNPASVSNQRHFNTHIRYTELFLNYAEAANEAWGPDGTGSNAYSARDIIAAIRKRAGIRQPDQYLESLVSQEEFRDLIRNERRLELCFEGYRFWDLRRWKQDLTTPARGVRISNGVYEYFTVEPRSYDNNFMHYGPIPDREITKFQLVQNKGWN
jgi:hypothetical protein